MRIGTYSIVARDEMSGDLGVAVHSHWFSVGSVVSWARCGAGAVATQSVVEPAYGPAALERCARGAAAPAVLHDLLLEDDLARVRQVAVVDARGGVAVHTGPDCIPVAGHVTGEGFACQANLMADPGVPEAMAEAFAETGRGGAGRGRRPLADRLLAALEAAERAGGDVRGRQSAALLVVPTEGEPWRRTVDVRVDDHADPVTEIGRLLVLARAYGLAGEADERLAAGDVVGAGELYRRASEIAPQSDELLFWAGLAMAHGGDVAAGTDAVRRAAEVHPGWLVLLDRLAPEFAPSGDAVRRALGRARARPSARAPLV